VRRSRQQQQRSPHPHLRLRSHRGLGARARRQDQQGDRAAVTELLADGDGLARPRRQRQLLAGQVADGGLVGGHRVGQARQLGQRGHARGQAGRLLAQAQLEAGADRDRIESVLPRPRRQQAQRRRRGDAADRDQASERL
jgi:hypothetical protein